MKKTIVIKADVDKESLFDLDDAIDKFEDGLIECEGVIHDVYEFDEHLNSRQILALTKIFRTESTMMYIMSCIINNSDWKGDDQDTINLANTVYETWLKDESDMPICRISDNIINLINEGELTLQTACSIAGRPMVRIINNI